MIDLDMSIKIAEMFGPTLQGEGRSQGRQAAFIRLGLCNLDCKWCDTPYTWDWKGKNGIVFDPKEELKNLTIRDVIEYCEPFLRLIITGGEPFVQRKQLETLTNALIGDHVIEVETNGTFSPEGIHPEVRFNVSPKIGNSGVAFNRAVKPDILSEFAIRDSDFKFVIASPYDIDDVLTICDSAGIRSWQVYLMPEGRTREEILDKLPWLFELCAQAGFNLSPRLHVITYGNERGI